METDKFNALVCPIPHCDQPLHVVWECFVGVYDEGGFANLGRDDSDDYGPASAGLMWWKVQCVEGEHVVMTANDEWPGCWDALERDEVGHSDEEGWDFSIDRLRAHVEAMQRALSSEAAYQRMKAGNH